MKNILVTGGAGYLGSVLVPELLRLGHRVTVVDNLYYKQSSLLDCCIYDNFFFHRGDARDSLLMKRLVRDQDFIFPLAALVGAPLCEMDKIAAQSLNTDAVRLLCDITSKQQRIIIPITNSGYGVGQSGVHCTEESPLNPISLYGITKVEAEKAVLSRGNAISLRLATVFGMSPRMRLDLLVNDFTYRAVKDRAVVLFEGHFKRNYIHIRDVARAFMHAMENFEKMMDQPYNVGLSDANFSKIELCERIKHYLPQFTFLEAPLGKDPDQRNYIVSNERIEKTGFRPTYSIDMGIKELIKGFSIINNNRYGNV
ncbi:MAG: SDR family oxidoreductase [Oligoflexia bacterium]|nr:SDR family oxidoreductase [Oligoflexia bacterium]